MDLTATERANGPGQEAAAHSMMGMGALVAALREHDVQLELLLQGTGRMAPQLVDPQARMSQAQKLTISRNARRLSPVPDLGLRAGARQRLSDFSVYGYALVSSPTFGD